MERIHPDWKTSVVLPLVAAVTLCFPLEGTAAFILDNLGTDFDDPPSLGFSAIPPTTGYAVGFQIDAGSDLALSTVTITARAVNNTSPFVLQIFTDAGGIPGSADPGFSISSAPIGTGALADYAFLGSGTFLAGSTYWLVASTTDSGDYEWGNRGTYTPNGATFSGTYVFFDSAWVDVGFPLSMQLDASPVPEPAQSGMVAALFLVACSMTHIIRRRAASIASTSR